MLVTNSNTEHLDNNTHKIGVKGHNSQLRRSGHSAETKWQNPVNKVTHIII